MRTSKKIVSILMAVVMMVSVVACLDFSAFAASEPTAPTEIETFENEPTTLPTVETTQGETQAQSTESTESTDEPAQVDPQAVGKVSKLYKDTTYTDQISFYWDEVEGADGYRIYYKNNDVEEDYRLLTTTTGTKVTVKDLPHTSPFQFKVAAYVFDGGKIVEGEPQIGKTATQPADTNKPSLKKCSSSIKISWNKNSRADGYKIYRQDASTNGKLVLYKTIKKNSTTTFEDKKVKGGRAYNYQVRAYREMYKGKTYYGKGSTLRTVAGLCAPSLTSCTSQLRRVTMNWSDNKYADGYDVYYKADDRDSFKLLKNTTKSYHNSKRLRAGHKYYFRIKPYKYVGKNKTKVYGTYRAFNKKATTTAYGKKIGNTYIEISIKQQRMWYYRDGDLYVETPVVTGNVGAYSTPTGAYSVYQKLSPATLTGPTWSSHVDYWMAFTYSGCGIHDASWRSSSEFGGSTYKGNGSHGCVNTPTAAVKKMYKKVKIGTPVVVY
ncbi:MAG: L,D-transpeptidase family protein [Ruminococcus sp.]|nr:L,D-transpeptidase family protein [Ruminococcus sp.]